VKELPASVSYSNLELVLIKADVDYGAVCDTASDVFPGGDGDGGGMNFVLKGFLVSADARAHLAGLMQKGLSL
jgi:hypothetical protein